MKTSPAREDSAPLAGERILVVEDDTLILMDLELILVDAGAETVGLCRSVKEALPVIENGNLDAAILDFGLIDGTAAELAGRLKENGIPFCFYTGQVATDPRLQAWRDYTIIQKPAQPQTIVAALVALVDSPANYRLHG